MEQILYFFGGVANLIAAIGGSLCAIFIGMAGIQWMMAGGDVQKVSQARMSVIGAIVGLAIVGTSFVIPDAVNQMVLRPSGANVETVGSGFNCDRVFKNQLVTQRTVGTPVEMNILVRRIQATMRACTQEFWDPRVTDYGGNSHACYDDHIGDSKIPKGLQDPGTNGPRRSSGRDRDNNLVVYFITDGRRPSDSAKCWLYISRLKIWDQTY